MVEPKETKAPDASTSKPKPCCVCIPQKQSRDECLLLNGQESGKCDSIIQEYKTCMKGFGFEVN
ncbi:hypothetical protein PACTADRAFT_49846 [Pachysolen tannophilus NRRL Y-2460]|uniref:Cytochrome c oxidase copper chaperone n=1 Tax=Pachysolen tannophilus NRRL Y-2460 TaxID=669874 RepID=A0A1E4TXP3_PACTA|nr:hypothetical protein PACTADRAFT_49846 [Pachysolen tannophilus NRRL Y-2460]